MLNERFNKKIVRGLITYTTTHRAKRSRRVAAAAERALGERAKRAVELKRNQASGSGHKRQAAALVCQINFARGRDALTRESSEGGIKQRQPSN